MVRILPSFLTLVFVTGCVFVSEPNTWAPKSAGGNEWIDKTTGHKFIRLSRREGTNEVFYFHQNPFTQASDSKHF